MAADIDLDPVYEAAGREWNVDPTLLRAVASQESGGARNPNGAVSPKGAVGRMQIMPDTSKALGITDPTDPVQSIYGGAKYLSQMLDRYKTPELALAAYNAGPERVDAHLTAGAALPNETIAYVPGVAKRYQAIATKATPATPAAPAPDDPFTAALKSAQQPAAPAANDPFSDALTAAQKAATPATPVQVEPTPMSPNEFGIADDPQQFNKQAPGLSLSLPKTADEARALLAEKPGYTASNILPLRVKNDVNGQPDPSQGIEWDAGPLRSIGNAAIDLMDGPRTGTVTPAGSQLLFGAMTGGALAPSLARGTGAAIADTAAYGKPLAQLYDRPGANPLAPAPAAATTPDAAPAAAAGPQSVGAAASRDLSHPSAIEMTSAQVQAYRSTAEGQKLLEPQQPGVSDPNIYVPGVTPNAAEIEQTVNAARELKSLNVAAPEVSQEAKEVAAANNDKRQQFFSNAAGSPVTVQNLRGARRAQFDQDSQTTLSGATSEAEVTPIVDHIKEILGTPTGKQNDDLQKYVRPFLSKLEDDQGNSKITDPAELIGFRQNLNKMLSKTSQSETPTLAHVSDELRDIVGITDDAIEKAAPGYAQQRANYADYSRKIDEQDALQEIEPKLYGANNRMQYSRVQNAMRQIVDARQSAGANKFKSITDDTMQNLWALRDDLRRSASAQELAGAPGSDTAQNLMDIIKGTTKAGANLAAHGAIVSHVGPLGNIIYSGVKNALHAGSEKRAAAKQVARGMQMLHPDPSQLRNPFQPD